MRFFFTGAFFFGALPDANFLAFSRKTFMSQTSWHRCLPFMGINTFSCTSAARRKLGVFTDLPLKSGYRMIEVIGLSAG